MQIQCMQKNFKGKDGTFDHVEKHQEGEIDKGVCPNLLHLPGGYVVMLVFMWLFYC